ncbi:MAG TPA: hypothetical protein PKA55_13830 [Rhodoblastus sp.]|nr:hypothetical protein [Rhodoblastus sp.]
MSVNLLRIAAVLGVVAVSGPALSQQALQAPTPLATILPAIAGDGVFELKVGQSVDLTDRKVLLTFPVHADNTSELFARKKALISINGAFQQVSQGNRLNLKETSATRATFTDMKSCFLDFLDVVDVRGAKPVATFRFQCR